MAWHSVHSAAQCHSAPVPHNHGHHAVENEGKQSDLKIKMPLVSDIKYVWVLKRVSDIVLSNLRVI